MSSDDGATSLARPAAERTGAVGRSEQLVSAMTAEAIAAAMQVFRSISPPDWGLSWRGAYTRDSRGSRAPSFKTCAERGRNPTRVKDLYRTRGFGLETRARLCSTMFSSRVSGIDRLQFTEQEQTGLEPIAL